MSTQRTHDRPNSGWLRIGPILMALAVAGCQAGTTPAASGSPSASALPSVAPTQATAEPTPSATPVETHWELAGSMAAARDAPQAVAFADGSLLVVGNDQGTELWDPETGTWTTVAWIGKPRTNFALVRLHDGRAMVIGGMNAIDQSYLSTLVFDPAAPDAGWVMVDDLLNTARTDPAAVVLADGRVLVAGGYFRTAPEYARGDSSGTVLAAYRGPVADVAPENVGAAMATAELWDPATGEWTQTGPMTYARYGAAATLLADGRVLVVGSRCTGEVTVDWAACSTAELYDPATGRFSLTGGMPDLDLSGVDLPPGFSPTRDYSPFSMGSLMPLPDGGAVLIGKSGWAKMAGHTIRSLRYDAADGTWRQIGKLYLSHWNPMAEPPEEWETLDVLPRLGPMVAALPDGRILVAGGDGMGWSPNTSPTAELYEPTTDTWSALPPMPQARAAGAAVTLPDGSVMLVGGHQGQSAGARPATGLDSAVRLMVGS